MGKVILAKTMRYRGAVLKKGTPLDVTSAEEREFTEKGYATREIKAKPVEKAPVAATTAVTPGAAPDAAKVEQPAATPATPAQQYATRDMKAKT